MKSPKLAITLFILLTNQFILIGQDLTLLTKGRDSLETTVINSTYYSKTFNNYLSLKNELETILIKLQKKGFLESELINLYRNNDSVFTAKIHLNTKIDSIYIYHKKLLPTDVINKVSNHIYEDYFSVSIQESELALKNLSTLLADKGDPFITLQLKDFKRNKNNIISANLSLSKIKKRTIDNIIVKGYNKFPESYLKRYLQIKKGKTFNLRKINEKTKDLDKLVFANLIREPEILFTQDSTTLYLYLEKSSSNSFDGFLGFANDETTNKIKFNGYLNLNLTNNLNYGESLKFIYKSDKSKQRTIDVNAKMPYLFKSPIGLEIGLNIFKKDSTFNSVRQTAKLFYQLHSKMKAFAGIETSISNYIPESSSLNYFSDYTSLYYTLSVEFEDLSSNLLFPYKSFVTVGCNFGNRDIDNNSEKQTALLFKAFRIFSLNDRNSVYLNSEGKILFSDTYLSNELFRFGGINSIRGFEENSLFASLYSVINTEYRYQINSSIYINTIIDAAYFEDKINSNKEKLFGFGFGFGMITQAGILRIIYANGLTNNQPFKLNNSKIHISLSANF